MNQIELGIKEKIQALGKPLKEWDIDIYRGILTGYNEAFLIDGNKRKELIREDSKSAEIIRPILRGRDIKKYGYKYEDLWLINSHNGIKEKHIKPINIDDYPAVKIHLDKYYSQLEKRFDKGNTPYNLRNCAYMDDFARQKIIWIELADKGRFAYDENDNFLTLNGSFIMIGEDLEFICCVLNNPLTSWHFNTFCITSGVGTNQWRELYVKELFIPKVSIELQRPLINLFKEIVDLEKIGIPNNQKQKELNFMVYKLYELNDEEIEFIDLQ